MPSATPEIPRHWRDFLAEVDRLLPRPIALHCLGGFVVEVVHGGPRATGDLDYIEIIPSQALEDIQRIAGPESALARKHRLYFQHVGVASLPESYAERLTELFPGLFEKLRLFEIEPHDLALSKLARNLPIDREDVAFLTRTVPLSAETIRARYLAELRPIIIGDPGRHDQTLELWIDAYFSPGS